MKILAAIFCLLSTFSRLLAGESGLIQTYQPLDGFETGEPAVTSVACYAHNTHVGWQQAIRYITARYVPTSLDDKPVGDINLASLSHLAVCRRCRWTFTVTLDFTSLTPARGSSETQVVAATLECVRRIAGDKLASTPIETKYRPHGQEDIKGLVSAFLKNPKDKEFLPQ